MNHERPMLKLTTVLSKCHYAVAQGRGGGQVVSVPTFYCNGPSSNPAEAYIFSVKFVFEKNEKKQKRPGLAHSFWKNIV